MYEVPGKLTTSPSHPVRVRGLKLSRTVYAVRDGMSHPVRVRGLKQHLGNRLLLNSRRTPCGCVG